jgi:hypothetical protein
VGAGAAPKPHERWVESGYFTSRPTLKGLSQAAHGPLRARSHCRFVLTLIHFIPDSIRYLVPLFVKRQCDRTLGPLLAAESLFARTAGRLNASAAAGLWAALESARRGLAIVQHHDAITGTPCSGREGCTGVDQVTSSGR